MTPTPVAPPTGTLPGSEFPLGATVTEAGTNFAVASAVADGMELCLFDEKGAEARIAMRDCDADVWHVFVPGVGPGQAYGYRAAGTHDPTAQHAAADRKAGDHITVGPRSVVVLRSPLAADPIANR